MSFLAISFLSFIYTIVLLVVATICKKHRRVIFWSGAVALFLTLCALFATGIFKPEIDNTVHNATLMGVSTLMLGASTALVILAEEPETLLWRYWKQKIRLLMKKSSSSAEIVTECASQGLESKPVTYDVEQNHDTISEGIFIPKELDTQLARKVFSKAIERGFMMEDGHYYRWNENESKVLLAYMCGRIYCGDRPVKIEQTGKVIWELGRCGFFPDTGLNELFQTKDLGQSRSNRIAQTTPQRSAFIDEMFE